MSALLDPAIPAEGVSTGRVVGASRLCGGKRTPSPPWGGWISRRSAMAKQSCFVRIGWPYPYAYVGCLERGRLQSPGFALEGLCGRARGEPDSVRGSHT